MMFTIIGGEMTGRRRILEIVPSTFRRTRMPTRGVMTSFGLVGPATTPPLKLPGPSTERGPST
ncbi:hypothetical protein BC826DRAFT_1020098 [Russula brevipes]|nr:hypothetical protein BC826DRAFT_1020098 [Russula brevipes]